MQDRDDDAVAMDGFNFERYHKRSRPNVATPEVTIQASTGGFSMNGAASAAMGDPKAVEFLYDSKRRVIALRPAEIQDRNAYAMVPVSGGSTYVVSGAGFLAYHDIKVAESTRRPAKVLNGMLLIDLNDPGFPASSPRRKRGGSALDSS